MECTNELTQVFQNELSCALEWPKLVDANLWACLQRALKSVAIFEDKVTVRIAHLICFPHADVLIAIGEGHLSVTRSLAVKKLALINISRLVFEYSKGAYHVGKGNGLLLKLFFFFYQLMVHGFLMLLVLPRVAIVTKEIMFFLLNFELFLVHIVILHFLGSGRSWLNLKCKFALVVDISPVFGRSIDKIINQVDHLLSNGSTRPITAGSQIVFILAVLMSSAEDFLILIPDNFALVTIFETVFLTSSFLVNFLFDWVLKVVNLGWRRVLLLID